MTYGGGGFLPGPRKQGYSYRIELKFATNNGADDTSKNAKFKVIGSSTFREIRRHKNESSIFTPWKRTKTQKITFYA